MKKRTALIWLALGLLSVSAAASSSIHWATASLEDALANAKSSGKLLLLDFFQEYG